MDKDDAREIYGLLRDIKAELASIRTGRDLDHERLDKVEAKVDKVESILDRAMGARAILCAVASAVGAVMVVIIQYLLGR